MSKQPDYTQIRRLVFELRYDPILTFYDWKGSIADSLVSELKLNGFKVSEGRVDAVDIESFDRNVFVGLSNAGLQIENPETLESGMAMVLDLIGLLDRFGKFQPKTIARLGVRWMNLVHKRSTNFADILQAFQQRFLKTDDRVFRATGATLVDVGLPLVFRGERYNYNIFQGPMEFPQALSQFFVNPAYYQYANGEPKDFVPKQGLYFDVDVFKTDLGKLSFAEIREKAQEFARAAKEKFDLVSKDVLEGARK